MSHESNHEDIVQLTDLARRFQYSLRKVSEGARYRRSRERSAEMAHQMRRTRAYLELALEALEGRLAEDTIDPNADEAPSWVRSRVTGLARYLAEGASAQGSLEDLPQETGEDGSGSPPWPPAPTLPGDLSATSFIPIGEGPREAQLGEEAAPGFSGDCASLGVPDLLAMLQAQGKTGVLRIVHPDETINLHFDAGELVHAYSECSPDNMRLGEILVQQKAITQKRLNSVLFCHFSSPRKIGEILREGEIISEEQLEQALGHQVQELFHRLYSYTDATFHFKPGLPSTPENRARRNVIQLLLESARVHDERQAG